MYGVKLGVPETERRSTTDFGVLQGQDLGTEVVGHRWEFGKTPQLVKAAGLNDIVARAAHYLKQRHHVSSHVMS